VRRGFLLADCDGSPNFLLHISWIV
jgi:hypothetical protein